MPCSVGVPQGSVLEPLLVSIYTSALATIAQVHNVFQQQYADDTTLCYSVFYKSLWQYYKTSVMSVLTSRLVLRKRYGAKSNQIRHHSLWHTSEAFVVAAGAESKPADVDASIVPDADSSGNPAAADVTDIFDTDASSFGRETRAHMLSRLLLLQLPLHSKSLWNFLPLLRYSYSCSTLCALQCCIFFHTECAEKTPLWSQCTVCNADPFCSLILFTQYERYTPLAFIQCSLLIVCESAGCTQSTACRASLCPSGVDVRRPLASAVLVLCHGSLGRGEEFHISHLQSQCWWLRTASVLGPWYNWAPMLTPYTDPYMCKCGRPLSLKPLLPTCPLLSAFSLTPSPLSADVLYGWPLIKLQISVIQIILQIRIKCENGLPYWGQRT